MLVPVTISLLKSKVSFSGKLNLWMRSIKTKLGKIGKAEVGCAEASILYAVPNCLESSGIGLQPVSSWMHCLEELDCGRRTGDAFARCDHFRVIRR